MPQFVASLTYDSRGIIYDRNMFIIQATSDGDKSVLTLCRENVY